jgi:alpha-tubulin suppressor-like RCC1 family protein
VKCIQEKRGWGFSAILPARMARWLPLLFFFIMPCAFNASAQAIIQIASSDGVSFFVKSDGSLWRGDLAHTMGERNERMQRLMNELKQHPRSPQVLEQFQEESKHITSANVEPVDMIVSNDITAVAMNEQGDTFFIKDDGSLWAMGNNRGGHLGDGTFDTPDHPIQIVPGGVVAVAGGETFTIFLKDDGSLWGFGWNGDGLLGDGTENNSIMTPKQIVADGVVAIAAGYGHSLFIKNDGSLWGMGNNGYGQLGLGTNINHTPLPVEIVTFNVVSIAAAHYQSLFIKSDGSLWAMGLNDQGQIGDCTTDWRYRPEQIVSNNVVAVTAGYSGSLFLKKDGSLWGMGINWESDYGEGIEFDSRCPVQIFAASKPALVAGYYYNAQLKTFASIWAGKFNNSLAGVGSADNKSGLRSMAESLPGADLITIELLKDGNVRLTYSGSAGINYALDRSTSLSDPDWVPQVTNTAPSGGVLVITNTPDTTVNNFWRIRAVP